MITIEHLKKAYENVTPLKDVNTTINQGDVISVIGPSGTGKSTLIRCINMLETPTAGKIIIDGQDITEKGCQIDLVRRKVGMVFQSFNLFEHLTVIENLMLAPMDLLGKSKQEAYDKGMELLGLVGLTAKALNYPDELSGGQKQRVAIARALAMEPEILLFDEPTSALDPTMVGEVLKVILDLAAKGITMLIVTHEMRFARNVANRIFFMDEGGIYEEGTPEEIFEHPKKENTRRFIRQLKIFTCEIEKGFDFPAVVAQIHEFGRRHMMSASLLYKLHIIFEEMIMQIILPHLNTNEKLVFSAEYSMKQNEIQITVQYGESAFDPEKSDNVLSWNIVSAYSLDYKWTETAEEGLRNLVTLTINQQPI